MALRTLTLRSKISLLALVILIAGLGLFGWLGIHAVNNSIKNTLEERLIVARTLANQLDQTLNYIIIQMQNGIFSDDDISTDEHFTGAANSIQAILKRSGILISDLLVVDNEGNVLKTLSGNTLLNKLDMTEFPEIRDTFMTGEARVSGLIPGAISEEPAVTISTGIFSDNGEIKAAFICLLDIMQANIIPLNQPITVGQSGYLEIVDNTGMVMARTSPGVPPRVFEKSDHPVRFTELIGQGQATVGTCHRCHETGGEIDKERDVLAFAPLQTASWGVAIRQSESEALAPTHQIERDFLILGVILLTCTILLVLAVMRSVVTPIRMLTHAAKRVAINDFNTEIPLQRGDEIGELSAAFSDMRQEISRTRENLISDYKEVKNREEVRGQLLSSIISAQEEERKRIAREIHDEYGQTLTGLLMNVESLEDSLTPEQGGLKNKILHTKSVLSHTLDDMRKLTLDLRPSSLDDLGLVSAINAHLEMHLKDQKIKVKFNHYNYRERLSPLLEITIFRIIQEAVHNSVKHADANQINIDLSVKDDKICVNVEDDGQGFDVDDVFKSKVGTKSWGILGIKERTELLNGKFIISSSPGKGTKLKIEIPADMTVGAIDESSRLSE